MDSGVGNFIKAATALVVLVGCGIWIAASFSGTRTGSAGNNGSSVGMPTPPPTAIKMMEKMVENSDQFAAQDWSDPDVQARGQMEMMKAMRDEDPEVIRQAFGEMRQQMDKMQRTLGPEQARLMMDRMQQRMPQIIEQIKKERAKSGGSDSAKK